MKIKILEAEALMSHSQLHCTHQTQLLTKNIYLNENFFSDLRYAKLIFRASQKGQVVNIPGCVPDG